MEDLFDAGNDVRLDLAYPEFYRDQGAHAQLPSPLDTTTLLSNIARQLLDEKTRSSSRQDMNAGQNVQQLFHALQGVYGRVSANQCVHRQVAGPDSVN